MRHKQLVTRHKQLVTRHKQLVTRHKQNYKRISKIEISTIATELAASSEVSSLYNTHLSFFFALPSLS